MKTQVRFFVIMFMVLPLCMGYTGCFQPDRIAAFQPDYNKIFETIITNDALSQNKRKFIKFPITDNEMSLTIEQSVMYALRNNKALHIQQLAPIISGTFDQIERSVYDPEFFVNASYLKTREGEVSTDQDHIEISDNSDVEISMGLRQFLPYGTKIEMAIEKNKSNEDSEPDTHQGRIGLNITQSLLQGYGSFVNLAKIKMIELNTVTTEYELYEYTQSLVAETEIAYWEYVLAKQKINICKESLIIAKKQRNEIEQQISVGILPKNEAFAARAEVALREQALINAKSLMENKRLNLLKRITLDHDKPFDLKIKPSSKPDLKVFPIIDLNDRIKLAVKLRPDLKEACLRLKQKRLETIVTRNGLLPKLELFIVLGRTGYADSFSDSFRNINDSTYDVSVGMQFSHYLGNRAATSKHYGVQLMRQQALKAIDNLKNIVHFDVRFAFNQLEHARKQISATRMTLMLQEQTAKAEKDRFNVGASTALMVSQAYRDLLSAQIAKLESIINYRIALIKLYVAEGSLLERRGLKLDYRDCLKPQA